MLPSCLREYRMLGNEDDRAQYRGLGCLRTQRQPEQWLLNDGVVAPYCDRRASCARKDLRIYCVEPPPHAALCPTPL